MHTSTRAVATVCSLSCVSHFELLLCVLARDVRCFFACAPMSKKHTKWNFWAMMMMVMITIVAVECVRVKKVSALGASVSSCKHEQSPQAHSVPDHHHSSGWRVLRDKKPCDTRSKFLRFQNRASNNNNNDDKLILRSQSDRYMQSISLLSSVSIDRRRRQK